MHGPVGSDEQGNNFSVLGDEEENLTCLRDFACLNHNLHKSER